MWPADDAELERAQDALAAAAPPPWRPGGEPLVGGCFVCFGRGVGGRGARGEPGWAAAALGGAGGAVAVVRGAAGAPYRAGRLALREGPLLAAAVDALPRRPAVLLVDATGRDHPRRAGLALHLGAVLGLPTVGVTHRPLLARGDEPARELGAHAPLRLQPTGEVVGAWLRVAAGRRPLAVHAAWRTDTETAIAIVLAATGRARTPEPLRRARHAARVARAGDGG
jgi:deoxyribonuclease V